MSRNKNRVKETTVAEDIKKEEVLDETLGENKEPVGEQNSAHGESDEGSVEGDSDEGGDTNAEEPVVSEGAEDTISASEDVSSETVQEPAAEEVPPVIETKTPLSDLVKPAPLVPPLQSDRVEAALAYLAEYAEKMQINKHQTEKTGVANQARLYRVLSDIIRLPFVEFKEAMDRTLNFIHNHRAGVFSDIYSRRFFEQLYPTLSPPQVREFDNLLSILVTVGTASNRSKAMSQFDLTYALKAVPDTKAQQNLAAYFSAMR